MVPNRFLLFQITTQNFSNGPILSAYGLMANPKSPTLQGPRINFMVITWHVHPPRDQQKRKNPACPSQTIRTQRRLSSPNLSIVEKIEAREQPPLLSTKFIFFDSIGRTSEEQPCSKRWRVRRWRCRVASDVFQSALLPCLFLPARFILLRPTSRTL